MGVAKTRPSASQVEAHQAGSNAYLYTTLGTKCADGVSSTYGSAWTNGAKVRMVLDADAGTLSFYKDGVSQGVAFTGLGNGPFYPVVEFSIANGGAAVAFDTGQRAIPTGGFGANSLCF